VAEWRNSYLKCALKTGAWWRWLLLGSQYCFSGNSRMPDNVDCSQFVFALSRILADLHCSISILCVDSHFVVGTVEFGKTSGSKVRTDKIGELKRSISKLSRS